MLTNETKKAEWEKLIEEQKLSGLSKAEFCKRKGMKPARFYYYEGELRKKEFKKASDNSSFIPIKLKNSVLATNKNTDNQSSIRIIFKNGTECLIPEGINKNYLKEIIEVLQQC